MLWRALYSSRVVSLEPGASLCRVPEEAAAAAAENKGRLLFVLAPSQSNSSSCLDEQRACAAGAGHRCRPSVGEASVSLFVFHIPFVNKMREN